MKKQVKVAPPAPKPQRPQPVVGRCISALDLAKQIKKDMEEGKEVFIGIMPSKE